MCSSWPARKKSKKSSFHTFNALHQANKQIIISSDKLPRDIPTLEERLRSRFVGGMTIDMQTPDFETRCAIIQTKAQQHDIDLPPDVAEFLATNIQTNIRELEGALNQLLAFCEMRDLLPNSGNCYRIAWSVKKPAETFKRPSGGRANGASFSNWHGRYLRTETRQRYCGATDKWRCTCCAVSYI